MEIYDDTISLIRSFEEEQEGLIQGPSNVQFSNSTKKKTRNKACESNVESEFENKCQFNLNKQYNWKSNDWGKSPICIPAAMEVDDQWLVHTLDPNSIHNDGKMIKSQRIVHQAFQRSNIGGMLIQDIDYANMWDVLKKSSDISSEIKQLLKPSESEIDRKKVRKAGIGMFQIDFLLFHPIGGIFVMECLTYENSEKLLQTKCVDAMWQAKQACQNLLDVFNIITGAQFPSEIVHFVLCVPNLKKEMVGGIDQTDILDEHDFKDNLRFEEFWEAQIAKHQGVGVNYFENMHVSRLLALTFGFRSAKFTSLASNSLEIFRKIDSQESSGFKKAPFDFGYEVIFLNSEQLMAYNIAKNGQNMLLFGPPGSGKTLLIQLLAKEASEKVGKGRVVILLPYEELAIMYENFFKANRENQRRKIIINPPSSELRRSLASDSFDDIFADEVLCGGWIPKENRPNGQIIVSITAGRRYEKYCVFFAIDTLKEQLTAANFCLFELKSVMRNTGNICKYYSQFEEESNNQIMIGHNIEGSDVIEITTSEMKSAVIAIANRIKQYMGKEDEGSSDSMNYYCSPTDIAVFVAHEPVSSQVNQIKKALKEADIQTGSITEQLVARRANQRPIVAVDCSANVLSLEWPIVFVVNATQCPYSKNLSNPIISYSRAVSSLIVVNTQECKFPYFKYLCKAAFPQFFFSFFKEQDLYPYKDIIGEINLNQAGRFMFQFTFWLSWALTYIAIPLLLVCFCLLKFQFYPDHQCCTTGDIVYLSIDLIIVLLFFISAIASFNDYKKHTAIFLDLLVMLSYFAMIALYFSKNNLMYGLSSLIFCVLMSLVIHTIVCFFKIFLLQYDWINLYFNRKQCIRVLFLIYLRLLHFISIALLAFFVISSWITGIYSAPLFSIPLVILMQLNFFKLSFRPIRMKSIQIEPLQSL